MEIKKIGIVGSGRIGGNLGTMLAKSGYDILFSSRHPEKLNDLAKMAGQNTCFATVPEAVAFGDVILLSVPLKAIPEFSDDLKAKMRGKIVVDTSNPYPERDGAIGEEGRNEPGGMGVLVQRLLPGARIVRAFNTVYFVDLKKTVNRRGEKIGIPIAGDDQEAVNAAMELVEQVGLEPVVVGGLSSSKLFDFGSAVYGTSASAAEIREKLRLKSLKRAA